MRAILSILNHPKIGSFAQMTIPKCYRTNSATIIANHQNIQYQGKRAFYKGSSEVKPCVSKPYSYAYGKSNRDLIYKTIGQLLDERIQTDSCRPMVISHYEGIKKNWTQFNEDVNKIAKAMHEDLGLERGDVIGLWSGNSYKWIAVQYACARLGVILCTINPYYRPQELGYVLRKAEIKTLFMPGKNSNQELLNQFTNVLLDTLNNDNNSKEPFLLQNVVFMDGEVADLLSKQSIKSHSLDKLKNQSSDLKSSLTELVTPDDPAIIMFTSGTTGKPKGACLSHFTLTNNGILAMSNIGTKEGHSVCVPLPFFHSFAFTLGSVAMTGLSFQLVIPYLKHDANQLLEAINFNKSTHLLATPTLLIDMLTTIKSKKIHVPSLENITAGGATMPIEIAKELVEAIPNCTQFKIGYGATELGPCTTCCKTSDTFEQRTETIGAPLDYVEIKVVDPVTKKLVLLGEPGEIHSRGHNRMLGYWKDPERTKEAIDHAGWYNTGDLGVMDDKGFLKIIGRTKELIIVGGENVYPREIEEILHTHPAVSDVHVIGVPDQRKGEAICVWIKLKDSAMTTEEEMKQFCKDNLAYFKIPKYFMFVDSFPSTVTGKVQKFIMKEITCKKFNL